MREKILLLMAILLSSQVHAQSTVSTELGNLDSQVFNYVKEHFQASYHGEVYGLRRDFTSLNTDDRAIGDIRIMHSPTLIYKPTSDWQVLANGEFNFSDQPSDVAGASYPNSFYRGLFTLTRKNILNENENGVKLDMGIGRRQFNTGAKNLPGAKYALSSYGNNRLFATISKVVKKLTSSLVIQYLNNDYKVATETTWKNSVELVPSLTLQLTDKLSYTISDDIVSSTPRSSITERKIQTTHDMNVGYINYQWNDKVNVYNQFKYLHNENFTKNFQSDDDSFANFIGVGYSFNPKSSVTFEAGGEIFHAREEGRSFFSKKFNYPELALYLDFAI